MRKYNRGMGPLFGPGLNFPARRSFSPSLFFGKMCKDIFFLPSTGEENISWKNIFLDLNLGQGRKNILFVEVLFVSPVTAGGSAKFLPVE